MTWTHNSDTRGKVIEKSIWNRNWPEPYHSRPEITYKIASFSMTSLLNQTLVNPKSNLTDIHVTQTELPKFHLTQNWPD